MNKNVSSDAAPQLQPEDGWRQVWHTNCPNWMPESRKGQNTSGIFDRRYDYFETTDGVLLRLFECLHCGVMAYAGVHPTTRKIVVLTNAEVVRERWIGGFKAIALTLGHAPEEDRRAASRLLLTMSRSVEEMAEGEATLRELLDPPPTTSERPGDAT